MTLSLQLKMLPNTSTKEPQPRPCDQCRSRKVKCDLTSPICQPCHLRHIACTNLRVNKYKSFKNPEGYQTVRRSSTQSRKLIDIELKFSSLRLPGFLALFDDIIRSGGKANCFLNYIMTLLDFPSRMKASEGLGIALSGLCLVNSIIEKRFISNNLYNDMERNNVLLEAEYMYFEYGTKLFPLFIDFNSLPRSQFLLTSIKFLGLMYLKKTDLVNSLINEYDQLCDNLYSKNYLNSNLDTLQSLLILYQFEIVSGVRKRSCSISGICNRMIHSLGLDKNRSLIKSNMMRLERRMSLNAIMAMNSYSYKFLDVPVPDVIIPFSKINDQININLNRNCFNLILSDYLGLESKSLTPLCKLRQHIRCLNITTSSLKSKLQEMESDLNQAYFSAIAKFNQTNSLTQSLIALNYLQSLLYINSLALYLNPNPNLPPLLQPILKPNSPTYSKFILNNLNIIIMIDKIGIKLPHPIVILGLEKPILNLKHYLKILPNDQKITSYLDQCKVLIMNMINNVPLLDLTGQRMLVLSGLV